MRVSLPPEMIRPSAYSELGGRNARELSHSWPWLTMVASKEGGFWEDLRQSRSVWSREAEMTTSGLGKRTSRTWGEGGNGSQYTAMTARPNKVIWYSHQTHGQAAGQTA